MSDLTRSIGDRLLAMLLPNDTAGACVPDHGRTVYQGCGCTATYQYRKTCTINCSGTLSCGACVRTQMRC